MKQILVKASESLPIGLFKGFPIRCGKDGIALFAGHNALVFPWPITILGDISGIDYIVTLSHHLSSKGILYQSHIIDGDKLTINVWNAVGHDAVITPKTVVAYVRAFEPIGLLQSAHHASVVGGVMQMTPPKTIAQTKKARKTTKKS